MRVLVTSAAGVGHVAPMLGTARALLSAGHDVLVAVHPELHPLVERAGLRAAAAGWSEASVDEERRRRWPWTDTQPPAAWAVRMFTDIAAPAMLADLGPLTAAWRPDLVMHEEGEYAGPLAASAAGVPWVTHGWGSPLRTPDALKDVAAAAAALWRDVGLDAPAAASLYGAVVVDPCPPSLCPEAGRVPRRRAVRFEPPGLGAGEDRSAPWARQRARPLAYVGFGTVPLYATAAPTATVVEAVLEVGLDAVCTAPPGAAVHTTAARCPDRLLVERFVDLRLLLPHCSLVVCHAGAGTVLTALSHGLPLLLLPRGAPSQMRTAEGCVTAGVARLVRPHEASPGRIREELAALVSDETAREAAASVAAEMAAAPPAASLVPELEALMPHP